MNEDREREQDHEGEVTGLVPVEAEPQGTDGRVLRGGAALRGKQLRPYAKEAAAAKVKSVIALQRRVAAAIREETDDLFDLVKIMVKIANGAPMPGGQVPSVIQQRAAAEYLLDRVIGRPTAPVEIRDEGAAKGERARIDALPSDILDGLEVALGRALGKPSHVEASGPRAASASAHILAPRAAPASGTPIEVAAVEVRTARSGINRTVGEKVKHEKPSTPPSATTSRLAPAGADASRGRAVVLERSASVYGAWYDPDAREVTVTFRPGAGGAMQVWAYEGVDAGMISDWERAPSPGAWFARELRGTNGGQMAMHARRRLADTSMAAFD